MADRTSADVARDARIAMALSQSTSAVTSATLTQGDWYIDAQNRSGLASNHNDGKTATTPLLTHAEFERRIGHYNMVTPPKVQWGGSSHPLPTLYVHLMSDLPATDPVNLMIMACPDLLVVYAGEGTTVLATGTITAQTTLNRATNTANQITDGARVDAWSTVIGKARIRVTSGVNADSIAWPVKDLGAHATRITQWRNSGTPATFLPYGGSNATAASVSDPYAVEQLTKVFLGVISVLTQGTTGGTNGGDTFVGQFIQFYDLQVRVGDKSSNTLPNVFINSVTCVFNTCLLEATAGWSEGGGQACSNCIVAAGDSDGSSATISAIGTVPPVFQGGGIIGGFVLAEGVALALQFDFLAQGSVVGVLGGGGALICSALGVFDSPANGVQLGGEVDGIFFFSSPSALTVQTTYNGGVAALYGSGNAGVGLAISAGSKATVQTPAGMTITGTGGDFSMGGTLLARGFNEGTNAYYPAISTTWAHFVAAIGVAGFGGNAHHVTYDAHMVAWS